MMESRNNYPIGYKPYPPTTDKQVEWVKANATAIQELAEMFDCKDKSQRQAIGIIITKFLMLYAQATSNKLSEEQRNAAVSRQQLVAEAFLDDLSSYPAWAVNNGLVAYRRTPEGKWQPKTSGELLPFIRSAYGIVSQALKNCRRILTADANGLNVDAMNSVVDAIEDEKLKAHKALDFMNQLEKSCDVYVDPVGMEIHNKFHKIFHDYRIANAKKLAEEESEEE